MARRRLVTEVPEASKSETPKESYCRLCLEIGNRLHNHPCAIHPGGESLSEVEVQMLIEKRAKVSKVVEVSEKLADELASGDQEERHSRARKRFDFEIANSAKESPLRGDVKRVVESVFVRDIVPVYERLEQELHLGDDHSDRGTLQARLAKAAANMREAHRIFVTAKVEREAWETRNGVVYGAMWLEATKALQEEKEAKQRNKQITDGDVKAKAAVIFGDEWHAQETERYRVKQMVDSLQNLVETWTAFHRALEVLLGKSR